MSLSSTALLRSQQIRHISNNVRIIKSNLLRKVKKGIDRLPSQGPDPASQFKHGWRLASAAILERYPVITPDIHPFENEYLKDRFLDEQLRCKPIPKEYFLSEREKMEGKTEPSFEDPQAEMYTPAPRVTQADHDNDTKSLERALSERLYFLIKRSKKSQNMQFPQILVKEDNVNLKDYAEKALKSVTLQSSRPRIHFMSYSPACHIEHIYPPKYQQEHDVYGVKIFFYRGCLLNGEINEIRNCEDYVWARESELSQFLGEEYYNGIKPILLGVGPRIEYEV